MQPSKVVDGVEAALSGLEAVLGHSFARSELLVHALTHRSLANERAANLGPISASRQDSSVNDLNHADSGALPSEAGDNERLEFLGDAVLGLAVAEALFAAHPEWQEGELTRVRSLLVSRKHMAEVAQAIGLGRHLRLSRGEERSGLRSKSTVLSNTMEAVMGALFWMEAWIRCASLCAHACWGLPSNNWRRSFVRARRWAITNPRFRNICSQRGRERRSIR